MFRSREFMGSSQTITLKRGTPSKNWINNPWHLGNGARQEVIYYYTQVESRIRAFHWNRNWWPWITLTGVMSLFCVVSQWFELDPYVLSATRMWPKESISRQFMIYGDILRD